MPIIRIAVVNSMQARATLMEVPDDVEVLVLGEAMVKAMQLPANGAKGRPCRYQLKLREADGSLTPLDDTLSLAQNGVRQDASLQLERSSVDPFE